VHRQILLCPENILQSNYLDFCKKSGFLAITFEPQTLDGQSKALKVRILLQKLQPTKTNQTQLQKQTKNIGFWCWG